ncbi:MAG: hypothetical protein ACYDAS_04040 [Patescibacteria group bacterium]
MKIRNTILIVILIVLIAILVYFLYSVFSSKNKQLQNISIVSQNLTSCNNQNGSRSGSRSNDWMITYQNLKNLSKLNPTITNNIFNSPHTYIMESPLKFQSNPYGTFVAVFQSYQAFKSDLLNNKINANFKGSRGGWVLYDNEHWSKTPVIEQQNPVLYEKLFTNLAHQYGYKVILSPSQDLFVESKNNSNGSLYLNSGIAKATYNYADIYEIQAQSFEQSRYRSNHIFTNFVNSVLKQINNTKPIIVGLSVNRIQNATQLYNDFLSVKGKVQGFWLNVPGSTTNSLNIGIQFLQMIQNSCK